MKKIIYIIILGFFTLKLNAQTSTDNLKKYWHYRYRLVNYFMVVGQGPGKSLPVTVRNVYNDGSILWSETPRYLGWYLGVLATEYRLLKNNNQSTDRTLYELYCALLAVERLDKKAEDAWGLPESLNGCLIQDDVPPDFLTTYSQQLNANVSSNFITLNTGKPGVVNYLRCTFTDRGDYKRVMSQDMTCELMIGFALVSKCVENMPLNFSYNNQSYSVNLYKMAIDAMDRLVIYIKAGGTDLSQAWTIVDPDGEMVTNGSGGDFRANAYALAHAANFINPLKDYTGSGSEGAYQTLFQVAQDTRDGFSCPTSKYNNARMALQLASMCNCWKYLGNNSTSNGIKFQGDYDAGTTATNCAYLSNHNGFDLFYGMLHRYLYNYSLQNSPVVDLCNVRDILNSAPYDGPFFHNDPCKNPPGNIISMAPVGWRSSLRFSVAIPDLNTGDCNFRGNYNGLDYMLTYNLYCLSSPVNIVQNIPTGTSSNPYIPSYYPYVVHLDVDGGVDVLRGSHLDSPMQVYTNNRIRINGIIVNKDYPNPPTELTPSSTAGEIDVDGKMGVEIANIRVENGAYFSAQCTGGGIPCLSQTSYVFDPTAYNRIINPGNELPAYTMTDEFRQMTANTISCNPNPVKDNAEINISLVKNTTVTIAVYNLLGELVNTIVSNESYSSGSYKLTSNLSALPEGMYYLTMQTTEEKLVSKIIKQ